MSVRIYGTLTCPFCIMARRLLKKKGVRYDEIRVDRERGLRGEMERLSGRRTVPQIFVGEHHVGGFDELNALERNGELEELLAGADPGRA